MSTVIAGNAATFIQLSILLLFILAIFWIVDAFTRPREVTIGKYTHIVAMMVMVTGLVMNHYGY